MTAPHRLNNLSSFRHQPLTFEDLMGLETRGYVRDSKLDQRDGFGPDIQQSNIRRFAESYDLVLETGGTWNSSLDAASVSEVRSNNC